MCDCDCDCDCNCDDLCNCKLKSCLWWIGGFLLLTGIILTIALPIASLESLEPTEVGLDYNTVTITVDQTQLYTAGRHFIGVSHNFIKFPVYYKSLNFSNIECRTSDGLDILIDVSFQYQLYNSLNSIVELYNLFPGEAPDYESGYLKIATESFRVSTAKFAAFDFVNNRANVEMQIKSDLIVSLDVYKALVENFQLIDISYPTDFQSIISDIQAAQLAITTAQYNQQTLENTLDGLKNRSVTEAQIILNNAIIQSTIILNQADGYILATKELLSQKGDTYKGMKEKLNLTNSEIISYQWIQSLNDIISDSTNILSFDIPMPSMFNCISNSGSSSCP